MLPAWKNHLQSSVGNLYQTRYNWRCPWKIVIAVIYGVYLSAVTHAAAAEAVKKWDGRRASRWMQGCEEGACPFPFMGSRSTTPEILENIGKSVLYSPSVGKICI